MDEFQPAERCPFTLPLEETHVWRVELGATESRRRACEICLSPDERSRASRFVFDRDRVRFVVCRGSLRAILARYLHASPTQIEFRYAVQGKPSLAPLPDRPLYFNVSHSGELALIALRARGEVGVDVEQLRPIEEAEAIAQRYFTPREHATLAGLPAAARIAGFFRCWTRKEAMLKATGEGIGVSLDAVEVSLAPDEPARVLGIRGRPEQEVAAWKLYHIEPAPGAVGAIAARGDEERIVGWQWTDFA
jgi:4'-phosphopantetheinyl transferase